MMFHSISFPFVVSVSTGSVSLSHQPYSKTRPEWNWFSVIFHYTLHSTLYVLHSTEHDQMINDQIKKDNICIHPMT